MTALVEEADVVIIGSGMGGSVLAFGLAQQGISVLVVEQGTFLPREEENWSAEAVFAQTRYKPNEAWLDARTGNSFKPGVHYWVGGSTKVFGASLPRFREKDFEAFEQAEGISPAWPFSYSEFEPWYAKAELMFGVHGSPGEDPTEPWRSTDYPFPAVSHEPDIARLAQDLRELGLHPSSAAMAIDLQEGGTCIRCSTCDGFPCKIGAKGDAERCALRPALATGNARLLDHTQIHQLKTDSSGSRVVAALGSRHGEQLELRAKTFVVSAGAVNSAILLLNSVDDKHPTGLANSSGLVGRNYMVHNATFMVAVDPFRKNRTKFQKTLMVNDWYFEGPLGYPLGNVQMLGRLQAPMVKPARPKIPTWALKFGTDHSWDFYLESEDLPTRENFVKPDSKHRVAVNWTPTNMKAHTGLISNTENALKSLKFPIVLSETMGIETNSHQCGTAVAGNDPATSVLDGYCRSHDVSNLFVVDSSYFPSSAAVNPALTIAAQALRVAYEGEILR